MQEWAQCSTLTRSNSRASHRFELQGTLDFLNLYCTAKSTYLIDIEQIQYTFIKTIGTGYNLVDSP